MSTMTDSHSYVTLAVAGERLGVANMRDYRAKYEGFPEPAIESGAVRLWSWPEVRDWYASHVKARPSARGPRD